MRYFRATVYRKKLTFGRKYRIARKYRVMTNCPWVSEEAETLALNVSHLPPSA